MLRLAPILFFAFGAPFVARGEQQVGSAASIEALIRSGQYDQALQSAQSALAKSPGNDRLWTLEGIIFGIQGSNEEAEKAFQKALSLSPDNPAALKGAAQILYRAHDKRAIPVLEKILQADPTDLTAREMLAVSEEKQGDCRHAVSDFAAVADTIKTHPESLEGYGDCLMHTQQPDQAIPVFRQLASILPEQNYPKYDLAVLLVLTKHFQDALEVLEPLLNRDTSDADILSLASEAYEGLGDTPHAVPLLRQAILLEPTNPAYYVSFASLCITHDSFQTGVDMLNAGIGRIPENSSLYISRGMLYAQLAQLDKAEADFKTAEKLDSAQTLSSYALDLAELQKNHSDDFAPTLRAQVKAYPQNPLFHYLLAELLMNQGAAPGSKAFQEATQSALEAVQLKPDMVTARNVLATIYMRSGQTRLAIEQCRAALQYDPSDQAAIYHLILALRHTEHNEEIEALGKRLAELKQQSRKDEDNMKRYRLVEQGLPSGKLQ